MAGMSSEEELELLRCLKGHVIKTYKNGRFTDLTIKAKDGTEIRAHKLVLYAQNAWFARKLETNPDISELPIENFSTEVLKAVVDSIYYRKLQSSVLTKENVMEYLKAGETFYIDHIRDEAAMFMAKNLDVHYALDMIQKHLFSGTMADAALTFITENFQRFISEEKLKKRVLSEMKIHKLADILRSKNLMLWDSSDRFLPALEREKQLFFFVLGYVAQDKEARLPELKQLLKSLKMSLLVSKNIVNIHVMGAGLKAPTEEISGMIADVIEPFEGLKSDVNLASFTSRDKKDKSKSSAKAVAEASRMRYGSIPHQCVCSDLVLKLEPWSQIRQTKIQFFPDPKNERAVCTKNIKSVKVFIRNTKSRTENKEKVTNGSSGDENKDSEKDKGDKSKDKKKESTDKDKGDEDEEKESTDSDKGGKDKEKESTDKDSSGDKASESEDTSSTDKDKDDAEKPESSDKSEKKKDESTSKNTSNETKVVEDAGEGGEGATWRLCGIILTDEEKEHSLGVVDGEGVKSKEYILEKDEFITEISALYTKEKVSSMDGRGKKRDTTIQEIFSMTTVEDLSFKTNKERTLGPVLEGEEKPVAGLLYRLPKQIFRLEAGSPSNFWWLQGFGMEKGHGKVFFPIWKFQSSYKYYPLDYQGLDFVAGVKKQMQFSLEGVEECLELKTLEDLESLEKTPVHEVVDLDDSDDEGDDNAVDDGDAGSGEEEEDEEQAEARPNLNVDNEDSVMIVDSESEDDGEEGEDEEFDEEDEYQQGMLQHEVFGGMGSGGGMGLGGVEEPIEIPSSSDEEEANGEEITSNGVKSPRGKKRKENSEEKSPKKKK